MATAIVTGAASGIGRALAGALVERGDDVVLADLDGDAARRAADELRGRGGDVDAVELDVADAAAVAHVVNRVHDESGLDLLFNNAGIGVSGEPEEFTLEHWDRSIDVNLRGVVHGCHAAYPLMLARGHGRIVNTASLAGLLGGNAIAAPYAASKFGVVGLSLALYAAGADRGVGVHVLCPGGVDTPLMHRDHVPGLPTPPGMVGVSPLSIARRSGIPVRLVAPERIAAATLRGIVRDRPLIVEPFSARVAWRLFRWAPGLMLRGAVLGQRRIRRSPAG